ncbi:lantibiotic dehydratase [Paenibacillus sp. MZ04-78.2]|uniref:lantibiotic dehydratase n=1 Tax=Paenibacillus sp. MZ04-78.2 TaxID=2962034 RepID=UPI0020B798EF|nr:lantibiotic dehydratase [Paenibacillus sp. MZ04-78.2]MCP3776469.1 lantibiotic dehydratase [Paenibacillus sp. MZ04-78.2]
MRKLDDKLYKSLDFFMLRAPILSLQEYLRSLSLIESPEIQSYINLTSLTENPIVREAIAVTSPSLLGSLDKLNTTTDFKKKRQIFRSILRYFIRMTSRPTPYGLFSGVTIGEFADETKILFDSIQSYKKRTRPDMEWIFAIINDLEKKEEVFKQLKFVNNPLVYHIGSRLKLPYQNFCNESAMKTGATSSATIKRTAVVDFVMNMTTTPIHFSDLFHEINKEIPNADEKVIIRFIKQLMNQEFLLSNLRPPLTDESPFKHLVETISSLKYVDEIRDAINSIANSIDEYDQTHVGEGEKEYIEIVRKMNELYPANNLLQIDLALGKKDVKINKKIMSEVESAADVLWRLSPDYINLHLHKYKLAFVEKYGLNREVGLLELLDEGLGLGAPPTYTHPEGYFAAENPPKLFGEGREKVLEVWVAEAISEGKLELHLTEEMIKKIEFPEKGLTPPLSLEIYAIIAAKSASALDKDEYKVIINTNSGNPGAGRSFGRFLDILDSTAEEHVKNIYAQEEELRSDAIFAELIYLPIHTRDANITITKNLRRYHIIIGVSPSSNQDSKSISLSDLVVGLRNNKFYLKSKKLNKEVIITTGHMLSARKGTNVYRFLREISAERHRNCRKFQWGSLSNFPVLPRLVYRQSIISLAQWPLHSLPDSCYGQLDDQKWYTEFQQWRQKWRVPRFVFQTEYDNRILLDLENHIHVNGLRKDWKQINKNDPIILTETGMDFDEYFANGEGGSYSIECVVPLIRTYGEPSDNEAFLIQNSSSQHVTAYFPGSEWLYLKLYGLAGREEEFISSRLVEFFRNFDGLSLQYFFIRYVDPEPHIRLRIKSDPSIIISEVLPQIRLWTSGLQSEGLLKRMTIDTYEPETERYGGPLLIGLAEHYFAIDSEIVCEWLLLKRTGQLLIDKTTLAIVSILDIIENSPLSLEVKIEWLRKKSISRRYLKEFRQNKELYLSLTHYKNKWDTVQKYKMNSVISSFSRRLPVLKKYMNSIKELEDTQHLQNDICSILDSIIHMHINRLLGIDREQEIKVLALVSHTFYCAHQMDTHKLTLV